MNNLTERDLAKYLGTGVKIVYKGSSQHFVLRIPELYTVFHSGFENVKLILRPLSDLTKEITYNGETFVPIVRLFEMFLEVNNLDYYEPRTKITEFSDRIEIVDTTIYAYFKVYTNNFWINLAWVLDKLHEWQFACGLDESLWIDLNTLEDK